MSHDAINMYLSTRIALQIDSKIASYDNAVRIFP